MRIAAWPTPCARLSNAGTLKQLALAAVRRLLRSNYLPMTKPTINNAASLLGKKSAEARRTREGKKWTDNLKKAAKKSWKDREFSRAYFQEMNRKSQEAKQRKREQAEKEKEKHIKS